MDRLAHSGVQTCPSTTSENARAERPALQSRRRRQERAATAAALALPGQRGGIALDMLELTIGSPDDQVPRSR